MNTCQKGKSGYLERACGPYETRFEANRSKKTIAGWWNLLLAAAGGQLLLLGAFRSRDKGESG